MGPYTRLQEKDQSAANSWKEFKDEIWNELDQRHLLDQAQTDIIIADMDRIQTSCKELQDSLLASSKSTHARFDSLNTKLEFLIQNLAAKESEKPSIWCPTQFDASSSGVLGPTPSDPNTREDSPFLAQLKGKQVIMEGSQSDSCPSSSMPLYNPSSLQIQEHTEPAQANGDV